MEKELKKILDDNKGKRICVCGVSCTGKSTMMKRIPNCLDLDEIVWAAMPQEVLENLSGQKLPMTYAQKRKKKIAWTEEQKKIWYNHGSKIMNEFRILPGQPVFSVHPFNHADLIIYLDITDELLQERVKKRGKNLEDIRSRKVNLEQVIVEKGLPVIKLKLGHK